MGRLLSCGTKNQEWPCQCYGRPRTDAAGRQDSTGSIALAVSLRRNHEETDFRFCHRSSPDFRFRLSPRSSGRRLPSFPFAVSRPTRRWLFRFFSRCPTALSEPPSSQIERHAPWPFISMAHMTPAASEATACFDFHPRTFGPSSRDKKVGACRPALRFGPKRGASAACARRPRLTMERPRRSWPPELETED